MEASTTPTICRLPDLPRHQLLTIARSYNLNAIINWTTNGVPGTTTTDDEAFIRWLRLGITRSEVVQKGAVSHSGCNPPCRTSSRTISVLAGNGLISLGSKTVMTSIFPRSRPTTTTSTYRLLRIDKLTGRVYPMGVGNQFSYETTNQSNSPGLNDEYTSEYACEVSKKYDAKSFHSQLSGAAYLLICNYKTAWRKTKAANTSAQSKEVFFESLGIWLSVDPVSPRERLVQDDGNFVGTYTLKTYGLVR